MNFGAVNSRKTGLILFVIIAYGISCFLIFRNSLNNFYVSDDFILLTEISRSDFLALFWHYPPDFPHFFRPFSVFSYRLFFILFGYAQNNFLYFNFLLHLFNSFFVFILIGKIVSVDKKISDKRKLLVSFFGGLLFSVHYIHSEPVLFMAALSELLFSFFYLLALIFYFRYKNGSAKPDKYLIVLFFILSLLSKETGISLIVLLFFAEKVLFKTPYRDIFKNNAAIFIIGAAYMFFRFFFFPKMLEPRLYFMNNILFEVVKNIVFSCTALFFSLDFMAIKDFLKTQQDSIIISVFKTYVQFPSAVIAQVLAFASYFIMIFKKDKIARFGFIFILIAVSPTLWLAGFERYLYLPSAGFSILVIYYLFSLFDYKKYGKPLAVTLLLIILLYNVFSLSNKNQNWNIAAMQSKNIVEQLQNIADKFPPGYTVYFKGLPDNYKGAWVFRNGIEQIPVLFLGRKDLVFKRADMDYDIKSNQTEKVLLVIYSDGKFIF